jgi:hypothetical protein
MHLSKKLSICRGQGRKANSDPHCRYYQYDGCFFAHEGLTISISYRTGFPATLAHHPQ